MLFRRFPSKLSTSTLPWAQAVLNRGLSNVLQTDLSNKKRRTVLKLLIIDGYEKVGREGLTKGGMLTAGELFVRMMNDSRPDKTEIETHTVFPCDPDFEIPSYEEYDGIAWTGSSLSVTTPEIPGVKRVLDIAQDIRRTSVPQFGSCYGLQLAGVVFGGECGQCSGGREMGIGRKNILTPAGRAHPMYEGKPEVFDAFSSHNDEISAAPPGLLKLAGNAHSRIQGIAVDYNDTSFWAVQYHPEYDLHDMARLTNCRIPILMDLGFFREERDAHRYIDDLEILHENPSRKDVAWRLAIDESITDPAIRQLEVRNWLKRLVLPVAKAREQNVKPSMKKSGINWNIRQRVAVAFDVDGVLVLGGKVVDNAANCLKQLQDDKIPFIFMTNGGGYTEAEKAKQFTEKFGIEVHAEQICLAHTPMKALLDAHKDDRILIVGKRYDKLKNIMKTYGFNNIITTEEWHANEPKLYSDLAVKPSGIGTNKPVDAIMMLNDPIMWGRDLQIVTDAILMSEIKVKVYSSCADLTYATDFDMPRYGAGSFRVALDSVFSESTGKQLEQKVFGKPHRTTYNYAESMLDSLAQTMGQESPDLIFGIGDNVDTDILGANQAGGRWFSLLTKGGLYVDGPHEAKHLANHLGDAVAFMRSFSSQVKLV